MKTCGAGLSDQRRRVMGGEEGGADPLYCLYLSLVVLALVMIDSATLPMHPNTGFLCM